MWIAHTSPLIRQGFDRPRRPYDQARRPVIRIRAYRPTWMPARFHRLGAECPVRLRTAVSRFAIAARSIRTHEDQSGAGRTVVLLRSGGAGSGLASHGTAGLAVDSSSIMGARPAQCLRPGERAAMNAVFDRKPVRHGPATRNEKTHEFPRQPVSISRRMVVSRQPVDTQRASWRFSKRCSSRDTRSTSGWWRGTGFELGSLGSRDNAGERGGGAGPTAATRGLDRPRPGTRGGRLTSGRHRYSGRDRALSLPRSGRLPPLSCKELEFPHRVPRCVQSLAHHDLANHQSTSWR